MNIWKLVQCILHHFRKISGIYGFIPVTMYDEFASEAVHRVRLFTNHRGPAKAQQGDRKGILREVEQFLVNFKILEDVTDVTGAIPIDSAAITAV
jgi:hypothetical protein